MKSEEKGEGIDNEEENEYEEKIEEDIDPRRLARSFSFLLQPYECVTAIKAIRLVDAAKAQQRAR